MIRLLLVDDHQMLRESLAYLLDLQPDLAVVGQAGSLADARTVLTGIDVALLDLDLPDGNGATLIREIRLANPTSISIVLTGSTDPLDHALVIEQGAGGILNKTVPTSTIIEAIRRVHAGQILHSPAELMTYLGLAQQRRTIEADRQRLVNQLTAREIQLLEHLAQGLTDQEIAERLFISPRTVQTQMARLYDKLGTDSRLQTLIVALRHKIVDITP
jgi:two-component system response regulator DevR